MSGIKNKMVIVFSSPPLFLYSIAKMVFHRNEHKTKHNRTAIIIKVLLIYINILLLYKLYFIRFCFVHHIGCIYLIFFSWTLIGIHSGTMLPTVWNAFIFGSLLKLVRLTNGVLEENSEQNLFIIIFNSCV